MTCPLNVLFNTQCEEPQLLVFNFFIPSTTDANHSFVHPTRKYMRSITCECIDSGKNQEFNPSTIASRS